MAQAIDIQIQRSLSNTPTNLLFGEPAWDDTNKSFYIGDSTGTPSLINNVVAISPELGQVPRWDGTKYVNSLLLNTGTQGCSLLTIDDTGLDWCNYQVGNTGSAFQTLKRSLGTIDVPLPLPSGTKIGGIGFIGFDDATFDPGYVSTEIASVVTEDQNATSGGAELQFKVTANATKNPLTALIIENDGTLSVRNQLSYELKVLDDNDIPNKRYVDNAIISNVSTSIGDLVDVDLTVLPQTQDGNLLKWSASDSSYVPSFSRERTNGVLAVDLITDYETLVTNDDDVPNKKYVDDLVGGLTGTADMTAVQLRKTTAYTVTNRAFSSLTFDTVAVENNTDVVAFNTQDASGIDIKETGLYLITYTVHSDGLDSNTEFRIRLNFGAALEGSQAVRNESSDNDKGTVSVTLIASLSDGDNIGLQARSNNGTVTLDPPTIFGIVRLKGSKGDNGDAGVAGADGADGDIGPMGFGMYAWSETDADGTQIEGQEVTVSASATGIYDYVFDTAAPSANYGVFVQPVYAGTALNTVEKEVYNKTVNGFTIRLNQQDDGGGSGANVNFRHSVSVLGIGGGLPTGTLTKGTAPDNEFVFFNGTTLNSNGSISYDTTFNNINIESQNTNASALNINTSTADSNWLSFTYQSNYVGGFFGVATDSGELGLILGDVGQQNTIIYQGTVNTAAGYQIANTALSLYHLGDTAASTQSPATGAVLRWNGTEWIGDTPPTPVFDPGMLRVSSQGADQSANYNLTTISPIVLSGPTLSVGLGSTYFSNNNGTITCNFDGVVKARYHLPHFSNTTRSHLKTYFQVNGTTYGPASYSYIRVGDGERRDDNVGDDIIPVSNGDTIRVVAVRGEDSTRTGAITLESNCIIILERIE